MVKWSPQECKMANEALAGAEIYLAKLKAMTPPNPVMIAVQQAYVYTQIALIDANCIAPAPK